MIELFEFFEALSIDMTNFYYHIFVNWFIPVLIFLKLKKTNSFLKSALLSFSLIPINMIIGFFVMWILGYVRFVSFLTAIAIIPGLILFFKNKLYSGLFFSKAVEILIIIFFYIYF